jgi:radical SAM superfamily enzyme YgiQ (UPF0313 family)
MCKPNGSLAYPNIGGALRDMGVQVDIYDACVGNQKDNLDEVFYKSVELETGLLRTGVSEDRILEEVTDSDLVGLTSIFSDQETMVLRCARLIKEEFPDKLIVAGGVNARSRRHHFFKSGIDIICLSEAEQTIQKIVRAMQLKSNDFSDISAIAYQKDGQIKVNPTRPDEIIWDLDELPMPAWDLLPNERYWTVGRPHGGHFDHGETLRYASMMTSMGCVFACKFCHIAGETEDGDSGAIGRFRIKSDERVIAEIETLKELGVRQLFLEDDSLFGRKKRMIRILKKIKGLGFDILDVNGVNIVHLLKNYQTDMEVLEGLVDAGFKELSLPFESGNPRIIRKYANNKWDVERTDIVELIKLYNKHGITIAGNYMLGFPDETREEIQETIDMAKKHMDAGLDSANIFLVLPLPGTPLFDTATEGGYLPEDFNIDRMHWLKANMINTAIPADELERIRGETWKELNDTSYVNYKMEMKAKTD